VSDPERFIGSKGLKAELLASAKGDRPPASARRKALLAAAAVTASTKAASGVAGTKAASAAASTKAASVAAGTKVASATLGTVARVVAWKWVAVGAVGLGTVVAAKAVVAPREVTVATAPAASHVSSSEGSQAARRHGAPAPLNAPPPESPPDPIPEEPAAPSLALPSPPPVPAMAETPSKAETTPAIKRGNAAAPTSTTPAGTAKAPGPSSPASTLSAEIAALDQAKRALGGGDAAEAIRQIDAYRAAFHGGILAAEASGVRIQALVRAGRRDEARAELARLRAGHPESPLLESLGPLVGE
jgi:hypothetical protein